jgi:hypothetical protein
MLPLFFPACKFLQLPVQVPMGFLTCPVGGHQTHDHARHSEDQDDYNCCFHMIRVPCSRPSIMLIAIAEMNMPVMIHTRSISLGSPHSRRTGSRHRCIADRSTHSTCTVSSQAPYRERYRYHIVRDDHDLHYHTYMPRYTDTAMTSIQNVQLFRIQIYMPLMLGFI